MARTNNCPRELQKNALFVNTVLCILGIRLAGIFLRFGISSCQFPFHTVHFPFPQTLRSKAADPGGPADAHEPPVQHADSLPLTACSGMGEAGLRAGETRPGRGTWARSYVAGETCEQKQAELRFCCLSNCQATSQVTG